MQRRSMLLGAAGLAIPALHARAQTWPNQPVKVIVAFAPGGTTDVIARLTAQALSERLGKSFVVETRPGASGMLGSEQVARATDGHTLILAPSSHPTLKALYPSMSYDPDADFAAIAMVATTPYVLVAHPGVPVKSVSQLIAHAKQNPGKLTFASTGMGTAQHLSGELFKRSAGVDMLHVPYKGSGALRPDLLAGRIDTMFENITLMAPLVRTGDLRGLAVTTEKRTPLLPDVPTVAEAGLPGFEVQGWFALLGPGRTPPDVIRMLNEAVNAALTDQALIGKLTQLGAEARSMTPAELRAFMRGEGEKWGKVIRDANIRPE
jgi:tripartite-type tricarboxylate transporter receptor subunit TctC